jgi:hypothetical protein
MPLARRMIGAQREEVGVGQGKQHAVAADDADHGEVGRIVEGKRPQQDAVDHGEHRRGGTDAQRERRERDGDEARLAAQRADREPEILQQFVHAPLDGGLRVEVGRRVC